MKTIEEMLQNLGRPGVTEFALVSERLPCVKVGGTFKPVDDYAPNTEEILQMLVAAGGSWYVASLGPAPVQWAVTVEGLGTLGVQAIMRDRNVQARFILTQRDPFAVASPGHGTAPGVAPAAPRPPAPPTQRMAMGAGPPSTAKLPRPNPPPHPPSSAVALIGNEPFGDEAPRSAMPHTAPLRDPRARPAPPPQRAPLPAPPPLVAMDPGLDPSDDDGFDFAPSQQAPLPPPAPPEPEWGAPPVPEPPSRVANPMRATQISRPEPPVLEPVAEETDARAEMDALVLRLAEELDVGPRRVRVVIELVLETIDRTGLPAREALEALAAAEKAAKKK